jgi:hypothetical protein
VKRNAVVGGGNPGRALALRIVILAVLTASLAAAADAPQTTVACPDPEARAFDFWIGDWDIGQEILKANGTWLTLPAQTSVSPTLDGCALIEHWRGRVQFFWDGMEKPEWMSGLSVRAYDPLTRTWAIHWMDTRSRRFGEPYTGTFVDGRGTFFREWETPQGKRRGRITFSDMTENTVNWELAVSSDEGETWQTLWKMAMQRRSAGNQ